METVEVVIKLSKQDYKRLKEYEKAPFNSLTSRVYEAIANGIPLPEGYWRLVDTHDLDLCIIARMININATDSIPLKDLDDCIKNETKTILEADKDVK